MGGIITRVCNAIKKSLMMIILLDISICNASITGQGSLSAGLSADNKEIYKGVAIDYGLQSDSYMQIWSVTLNYDYSDAENRPSTTAGHQYLYNTSAISSGFDHEVKTPTPYIVWSTGADYRQSGELDAQGKRRYNWSSFTGPAFNKNIRQDISLGLNVIQGLQFVNNQYASNVTWDMQLTKRFSEVVLLDAKVEQECWDYKSDLIGDTCRDSYELEYNSTGSSTDLRISLGQTIMNEQVELLYGIELAYHPSSISRISIRSQKRNRSFQDIVETTDNSGVDSSLETSINIHSVSYSRQFSRISFNADLKKTIYEVGQSDSNIDGDSNSTGNTEELERSMSASYLLGSKICPSCSVEYQYRKSQQVLNNWVSRMLGIKYPLKKNWNGLLSLRQTIQDTGESFTSINFQLNYDGKPALVGR